MIEQSRRSSWAQISVKAVADNIKVIKSELKPGTRICAVVKADAYGHGLKGFTRVLSDNGLVDCVAVGKFSELCKLMEIKNEIGFEVLLLGNATAEEIKREILAGNIDVNKASFSVYSYDQFLRFEQAARDCNVRLRVHIRIDVWDSGMGMEPEIFGEKEDELFSSQYIEVLGVYSHLYTSYSGNRDVIRLELERFSEIVNAIDPSNREGIIVHVLNSSLIFMFPEFAFDMVRAGSAVYGLPCDEKNRLVPAMKLCATVFDVRTISHQVPLSYESTDTVSSDRKIARIMFGYWDSPFLLTQNDIRISINGKLFRPADEVCMDNLCIDVTGDDSVKVGDTAVLIGTEGLSVREILERNDISIVHGEWMCMTATRLEKVYI